MSGHREIPVLPDRPRVHPVGRQIDRSYPVGRENFSRACQGKGVVLTITTNKPFPENIRARLMTTLNSEKANAWTPIPFERTDDRTLVCRITPNYTGLHS